MSWTNLEEFRRIYEKVPVEEFPNRVVEKLPDPILSVKVSTYQHARFIERCLDGILMQKTSFPFEIVIGEDESSDGTREICIEYAKRYPDTIRLLLHSRENNMSINGRPSGRFQSTYTRFRCRGRYVALCEGDDYWTDQTKLEKQVAFLESHLEFSLCTGGYVALVNGKEFRIVAENREDLSKQKPNGFIFDVNDMSREWLTMTLTAVYRASAFVPSDFSQYKYTRDEHLFYHLIKKGRGFYFQNVMGVYNVHNGGVHTGAPGSKKHKLAYLVRRELYVNNRDEYCRRRAIHATIRLLNAKRHPDDGAMTLRELIRLIYESFSMSRSLQECRTIIIALVVACTKPRWRDFAKNALGIRSDED